MEVHADHESYADAVTAVLSAARTSDPGF